MPRNEFRTIDLPIADELAKRAGTRPRVRPQECAPYAVAGVMPKLVFSPRSLTEASKTITTIAAEGASISIRGAGTKQWRPPHPYDIDVVLDATRVRGVIEHTPADLTATVAAGTPVAELQAALRVHGQFFPCDPPFGSETTVGGMLSSGFVGALRQRYGAPRDNVLGMRVCLSDGSIAFSGSRVVKSVAGYDIHKLFSGAWGTLGLIGEVTLKVAPLPHEERGIVGSFARCETACDAALLLASSSLFPLAMTLHDQAAAHRVRALGADAAAWTLIVRCGGARGATIRQADAAAKIVHSCGASIVEPLDRDRLHFAWSDVAELAGGALYPGAHYLCMKIGCKPSLVAAVLDRIAQIFPEAQSTAHPASGAIYTHVLIADGDSAPPPGLTPLLEFCEQQRATVSYLAAPAFGRQLRAPAPLDAPVALMRAVKAAFDPSGTFDPGRFLAGI